MSLDYGLGTMTATTLILLCLEFSQRESSGWPNGSALFNKLSAMTIYGKTFKIFFYIHVFRKDQGLNP